MPPTALRAPRGVIRGPSSFDCGAGQYALPTPLHRPGGRVPISQLAPRFAAALVNPEKDRTEGRGTWQQRRRAWQQREGNASTIATCEGSDGRRLIRTPDQRASNETGPRQGCTVPAILASPIWRDPTTESPSMSDAQLDRSSRVARRGANEGRPFEAVDEVARFELLDTGEAELIARDLAR